MDILKIFPRVILKDLVFIALFVLYLAGPLHFVSGYIHVLWSIPALFVLSAIVWDAIEAKLSKVRVPSKGKAIFITGCDSGFGYELSKRMASKGYEVFSGCLFPDGDGANSLRDEKGIHVVPCDVTKEQSIEGAVQYVNENLSQNTVLWGLVANAGVAILGPLEWCSMNDIQTMFDVNVFGVLRTVKAFLPLLRKSRGRAVITASSSATTSCQQLVAYSMSKAAVKSLTDGLRREITPHSGIYFTAIQPTFHRTPMVDKNTFNQIEKRYNALPEDLKQQFSPRYLQRCQNEHASVADTLAISDLTHSLKCFEHALTSIRPRPFYYCDRPLFLYFFWPMVHHFPVETTDFIFTSFYYIHPYIRRWVS